MILARKTVGRDWWLFPTISVNYKKGRFIDIKFLFLKFELEYFKYYG